MALPGAGEEWWYACLPVYREREAPSATDRAIVVDAHALFSEVLGLQKQLQSVGLWLRTRA